MKPLAKKQSMSNDAWIEVIDNIISNGVQKDDCYGYIKKVWFAPR